MLGFANLVELSGFLSGHHLQIQAELTEAPQKPTADEHPE
jgi:hypothetical protein